MLLKLLLKKRKITPQIIIKHTQSPDYPPTGWILGFTEAEGSFYLTKKEENRIVHGYGWVQKKEKELLNSIRARFSIKAKVNKHLLRGGDDCYSLDTTSFKTVETAILFFEKKMKGQKSVLMRMWARSYRKYKGNYKKLFLLQQYIQKQKRTSPSDPRGTPSLYA
jgi:hypothetical protein